jgi:hypothetical protein
VCRPWWTDTTEGTRLQIPVHWNWNGRANNNYNRSDSMMPVVNVDPIQSNNARTMRNETPSLWRRMMIQYALTATTTTATTNRLTNHEPSQRRIPTTNQVLRSQYGSTSRTGSEYHPAGGSECMAQ